MVIFLTWFYYFKLYHSFSSSSCYHYVGVLLDIIVSPNKNGVICRTEMRLQIRVLTYSLQEQPYQNIGVEILQKLWTEKIEADILSNMFFFLIIVTVKQACT